MDIIFGGLYPLVLAKIRKGNCGNVVADCMSAIFSTVSFSYGSDIFFGRKAMLTEREKMIARQRLFCFGLTDLRVYGRKQGVEKVTKKSKEELIEEIILIASGELTPLFINKLGAPIKHHTYDAKMDEVFNFAPNAIRARVDEASDIEKIWEIDPLVARFALLPTTQKQMLMRVLDAFLFEVEQGNTKQKE